jgi:hypothetical protein
MFTLSLPAALTALSLILPSAFADPTKVSNLQQRQSGDPLPQCPFHNGVAGVLVCDTGTPNQITSCGTTLNTDPEAEDFQVAIHSALVPSGDDCKWKEAPANLQLVVNTEVLMLVYSKGLLWQASYNQHRYKQPSDFCDDRRFLHFL